MPRQLFWFVLATSQIEFLLCQDLKSIFHIPSKRNYDEMEILERSNFGEDPISPGTEPPRSYANAQVMVRFGNEFEKGRCSCGERCQCRNNPYYFPVITPLPYYWCNQFYAPPRVVSAPMHTLPVPMTSFVMTPPPPTKPINVPVLLPPPMPTPPTYKIEELAKENEVKKDNVEGIESNNHPEIMKTVEMSEESIKPSTNEITPEADTAKLLEEVSNKLEPKELSPNVKLVSFDVSTNPEPPKKQLEDCLIPYRSHQLQQPKLLVTYPVFNRADELPVHQYVTHSGYRVSDRLGYYSDAAKTVIYNGPTVMSTIPPQTNVLGDSQDKYIIVPLIETVPTAHAEDCSCCSCAKYVGELNQQEQAV